MPPPRPVPNVLFGDTGGDLADHQQGGNQQLVGASQINGNTLVANVLFGDAVGFLIDHAQGGDDTLVGASFASTLFGDANNMMDHAKGGDDVLVAGPNINLLYGDANVMSGHAKGGNDVLIGTGSLNVTTNLFGDADTLSDHAHGGDDTLISGSGPEQMWGDAVHILGPDVVTGHDIFVFAPGNNFDTIHDFEPNKDAIDLSAFAPVGIHGFADLAPLIQVDGTDSAIVFDAGDRITVLGDTALDARDFLFA